MTLSSQVMQCIYDMFEGLGKRPSGDPKERAGNIFRKIDINGDGDLTENKFIKDCSEDKVASDLLSKYFLFYLPGNDGATQFPFCLHYRGQRGPNKKLFRYMLSLSNDSVISSICTFEHASLYGDSRL